ncbi:DUF397 domain-containing protein [Actinoplanes sp. URMC 104]|uniref:DUF397 domain-containing protein n=1 Tax=Actinoplanes sp. URMC 104 TaxID=3423409 RepID=UPI003F1B416A
MERNVWRTSSKSSSSGQCVEVMVTDDAVLVRDSKDRSKPPHAYTHGEWAAFVGGVKDAEFDL